ncbi:MAG: glycosyltransferase family 2 protein [Chloroflexi bacterium]|nr:glycosyltransferase family 2 protein [Chloroflexota bacterium]
MAEDQHVSVVIPHWNRAGFLPACLGSLRGQTYTRHEVILVDNGSTDGSLELLRGEYPWVRVIELRANRGFAFAVNHGIEAARGEFIALFNNDVQADPRWLEQLLSALGTHPEAGMATPKLLLDDRRELINAAGDYYSLAGVPGNRGVWEEDRSQFDRMEYVFGPGGAASLFRRTMLEALCETDAQGRREYFDEDFVSYCEDIDLAWRAQLAGYKCIYVPTSLAYHRLSATGGGALASYYNGRNFLYVIAKDYPGALLKKYWPRILRAQWRITWEALRAWRGEAARARLRGQLVGLLTFPRMLAKRRRVQRSRRLPDAELEALLSH